MLEWYWLQLFTVTFFIEVQIETDTNVLMHVNLKKKNFLQVTLGEKS